MEHEQNRKIQETDTPDPHQDAFQYRISPAAVFNGLDQPIELEEGGCTLPFTVKAENENIRGALHGGIFYLACDEAVGRYVRTTGRLGVGSEGSIHYYRHALPGDHLRAIVRERKRGRRLAVYAVEVRNEADELLSDASFTITFVD